MGLRRVISWSPGWFAAVLAAALVTPLLFGIAPASARGTPSYNPPIYRGKLWSSRPLQKTPSVSGHPLAKSAGQRARAALVPPREPGVPAVQYRTVAKAWWPSGTGTARFSAPIAGPDGRLPVAVMRPVSGPQRAGDLPITVAAGGPAAAPARGPVTIQIEPHKLAQAVGASGLILRVAGAPGRVQVRVDYAAFARNYGGSWASRLKLVELPACALTSPAATACHAEIPLAGADNNGKNSLGASVTLGSATPGPVPPGARPSLSSQLGPAAGNAVVLAAVSTPGGAAGNYAATSLSPEGTWAMQQGNFSYNYPITVPPPLGGAAPDVTLSYSSQTIDGETAAQNPQGSQIGDGWTYSPGYIEQSFEPCQQDSAATTAERGDECWDGYNATLSLGGHSGTLIGSGPGTWHVQNDDGTQVQLQTNGKDGITGTYGDEYWVVTTTNGTKYYFGSDHVPGSTSSSLTTSSAWNLPVYCPRTTDPCYSSSTGTSSWAQMPYRWNLDYVVDPDNNLTAYEYATESNYYMRGGSTGGGTLTSYLRGGYLTTALYGWHLADATASPAVSAADKIVFSPSKRCLSNCGSVTKTAYPDVPTDQICGSSGSCLNASPTYFSEERLTSINTYVLKSQSAATYNEVDSYALSQSFLTGTGETTAVLGLNSITRTGEDGTAIALPPTTFDMTMMDNRVTGTTQSSLYRPRITGIQTQAGADISITYNPAACSQGSGGNITNADAPTNTLPCYPAFWAPPGDPDSMDWFNYYSISQVKESDQTGAGSPQQVTSYSYSSSGVAWHQDENPAEPSAWRTWDEFRGYLKVTTTTGAAPDPITENVTWFMRGMNGDANGSGGTKSVSVSDSLNDSYTDANYLAGQELESDTYSQSGGSPDAEVLNGPWTYSQTASMTPPSGSGLSALTANMMAQAQSRKRRLLASGSWQTSTSNTYFTGNAQVKAVDTAPAGLAELCTTTTYATAPAGNTMMVDYPERVQTVTGAYTSGSCPAASGSNIVSDAETYYDDESATLTSLGTLGSMTSPGGMATGVRKASGWPAGGETWLAASATAYDGYGRVVSQTHPSETSSAGAVTTTSYSPATQQLPTSDTVKNPLGWKTVSALDQDRQLPVSITDPNGELTTEIYDSLGRLTSVTLPIDQGGLASYKYSYVMSGTSPPAVTTQTLREDGSYSSDVKIYDGMLQLVQNQTSTADAASGRLITDTGYDSHGWHTSTTTPFYDSATSPGPGYYTANPDTIPSQTISTYDGQGRVTSSALWSMGVFQWQTSVSYPGMDQSDTTPPAGGTPTQVSTNSAGQTATSAEFLDTSSPAPNPSAADATSYTYTASGQIASVTDQNGNTWTYGYNLLGEKTSVTDPGSTGTSGPSGKAGTTTYGYDGDGNMTSTASPDGTVLTWTYDVSDRKTAEFNATPGVPNEPVELASWAYDLTPINGGSDALGEPSSSTSYDSSGQAYVQKITGYTAAYQTTGTALTVPADQGALASGSTGTQYTTSTAYTPRTGLAEFTSYSADGGLTGESVQNTYDEQGLLTQFGDSNNYLDNVSYTPQGQVLSTTFGSYRSQLVQDYTYDAATNRLLQSVTNLQPLSAAADTIGYTYDANGDITSTSDAQNTGGTQAQCFGYTAAELTTAWTDAGGITSSSGGTSVKGIGGCNNSTPQASNIGGPAPYWETYTYDLLGDRTSETTYNTSLPVSQDTLANATTQEIAYPGGAVGSNSPASNAPATAQAQPDMATSIVTTSPGGKTTTTPNYNAVGQEATATSTSTGAAPPASPDRFTGITYNPQGQVASVTTGAGTSSYLYDANGNLLIEADPGSKTLYLDGGAEQVTLTGSALSGLRFLGGSPDGTTIVESATAIYYETTNQQHSSLEAINAASLAISRRYYDPWGSEIGTAPSWPDHNAYLGKPEDPVTSLDLLGARQYNPATGSFTSLDPAFEAGSALQMGGYSYAADNPTTNADPTGLMICDGDVCGSLQYLEHRSTPAPPTPSQIYQNTYYDYFVSAPAQSQRVSMQGPTAPGGGLILARFFIPQRVAIEPNLLLGDNRTFSMAPTAAYRIALAWDTQTGLITYTVDPSRVPGGWVPVEGDEHTHADVITKMVYMPAQVIPARAIGQPGGGNGVSISSVNGGLSANYSGLNSLLPCCTVHGTVTIRFSGAGISVNLNGNRYPDFEAIQYTQSKAPVFLAQSSAGAGGGLNSFPGIQGFRNETWLNGNLVSQHDSSLFSGWVP